MLTHPHDISCSEILTNLTNDHKWGGITKCLINNGMNNAGCPTRGDQVTSARILMVIQLLHISI